MYVVIDDGTISRALKILRIQQGREVEEESDAHPYGVVLSVKLGKCKAIRAFYFILYRMEMIKAKRTKRVEKTYKPLMEVGTNLLSINNPFVKSDN